MYVAGFGTNNAFEITPGTVITQIIDSTGDGSGGGLTSPVDVAVDSSGNAYVTGNSEGAVTLPRNLYGS